MSEEHGDINGDLKDQVRRLNREILEDGGKFEILKNRVVSLETNVKWQGKEIDDIKTMLKNIFDNTTWVKRAILTAIIGTLCSGVLGGTIAVLWAYAGR